MMRALVLIACLFGLATDAGATETTTYTYNARGELVTVSHSGNVNNGVVTTYGHDKVHNRTTKTTTGSP